MRVDLNNRGCLLNQRDRKVDIFARAEEQQEVHDKDGAEEKYQRRENDERADREHGEHEALTNKGAVDHCLCAGPHRPHPGHADEHGDDRDDEELGQHYENVGGVGSECDSAFDSAVDSAVDVALLQSIDVTPDPSGDGDGERDEQHEHVRCTEGAIRRLALQERLGGHGERMCSV